MRNEVRSPRELHLPTETGGIKRMRAFIVGITGDGYMPVVEDFIPGAADALFGTSRSVIGLPSIVFEAAPAHEFEGLRARLIPKLREELGYEADDLVPMEPGAAPGFLLAPLLRRAHWRERVDFVPGSYEVPLRCVAEWLRQRRLAGAVESQHLHHGLQLAQESFPRWARTRLGRAIVELKVLGAGVASA